MGFRILHLNDPTVRQLRKESPLRNKPLIGRGMFGAAFDNGDTILKLTVDEAAYMLATDWVVRPDGEHFAKTVHNYGWMGEHAGGYSIYLYEVEKLAKLEAGSEQRKLARRLVTQVGGSVRNSWHRARAAQEALDLHGKDKTLPESIRDTLLRLSAFLDNVGEHCGLDLHLGNFMVRSSSGTLIFNDPVCDYRTWNRRIQLNKRRFGF